MRAKAAPAQPERGYKVAVLDANSETLPAVPSAPPTRRAVRLVQLQGIRKEEDTRCVSGEQGSGGLKADPGAGAKGLEGAAGHEGAPGDSPRTTMATGIQFGKILTW